MSEELRRHTDSWFGWLTRIWDWIDSRQIDKHAISIGIFYGTVKVTEWAMSYAQIFETKPGVEVAAIIGAVLGPYSLLQAAAIKFYFEARKP